MGLPTCQAIMLLVEPSPQPWRLVVSRGPPILEDFVPLQPQCFHHEHHYTQLVAGCSPVAADAERLDSCAPALWLGSV